MPSMSEVARRGRRAKRVAGHVGHDLAAWRSGGLSSAESHIAARRLHRVTAGWSSRALLAALRAVPGSVDQRAEPVARLTPEWQSARAMLTANGIARVPDVLDPAAVQRVREFAMTAPAKMRLLGGCEVDGTYETRPATAVAVHLAEYFVLANQDIQSIIANPSLAELARRYFGIGAVIHPPLVYWTCRTPTTEGADQARPARRYHWDYDGLCGLRLHVNLTDVSEDSAPMRYLAGTHRRGALRTRTLRKGDSGLDDADVLVALGTRPVVSLIGPAGTSYMTDPQGLHRGTDPVENDRLFLVLPIQASGFAGYQVRVRLLMARNDVLRSALAAGRPHLRMFRDSGGPDAAGADR